MPHVRRFDHVGLTVADLDAVTAFFVALGLEVEGRAFVEAEFLDTVCGIPNSRTEIVMLKPPNDGTRLELFADRDVAPGDKRVRSGPPQIRIAAVVAFAVGLPGRQYQVGIVCHSDGVEVALTGALGSVEKSAHFTSRHQTASESRHRCAHRDMCPSEEPFASDGRRTNLGSRMQPAIGFRHWPHALNIRRSRPPPATPAALTYLTHLLPGWST
jgi:catechol 2,3-dioxygenase-like lactoylglutathione lyase family enzyme